MMTYFVAVAVDVVFVVEESILLLFYIIEIKKINND
jgi:hypothetical protein